MMAANVPCAVVASVTDQGDGGTCVCHSLGKAVVDGYQRKIFYPEEVDINQDVMIMLLLNVYKDCSGKCPDNDYDGCEFLVQDRSKLKKYWHFALEVTLATQEEFVEDIRNTNPTNTQIQVYDKGNLFYRIYARTIVQLDSEEGNCARLRGELLGQFQYDQEYNNSPAFIHRDTQRNSNPYYLYKNNKNQWVVGDGQSDMLVGTDMTVTGTGEYIQL